MIKKVFIVDDEQRAVDGLKSLLNAYFPNLKVTGSANSVDQALKLISESPPDLLFLDVEMGLENGFDLLERISKPTFRVVFVTAHKDYALRAIKVSALDYILKPVGISDLKAVLQKLEEEAMHTDYQNKIDLMFGNFVTPDKDEHRISISLMDGFEFLKVKDLMYITAQGAYSKLILRDKETLLASKNLKYFEDILDSYGFFRIHNSTLVNIKYIKRISRTDGGTVRMEDGQDLSLSKGRKDDFLQVLGLR